MGVGGAGAQVDVVHDVPVHVPEEDPADVPSRQVEVALHQPHPLRTMHAEQDVELLQPSN